MGEGIVRMVASLIGGAVIGWAASGLTLTGRIDALERTLPRIETRLDELVRLQAAAAGQR